MNKLIKYPLAKLLEEKGFNEYTDRIYLSKNNIKLQRGLANYPKVLYPDAIPAPTIAQVVMWIYEKYGIWINVLDHSILGKGVYFESVVGAMTFSGQNSPTEAYEAAIEYILNKLI